MNTIITFVKRHPLITFFILVYALSWSPSLIEPHGIAPFGPLLAALIMLGIVGGRADLKTFLGRIVHWRVGLRWYVLVLGLLPAFILTAVGLNLLLGATMSATSQFPAWTDLLARFVFLFFFIGLGEEPAWRGYALPRLFVGRSALAASLFLGLLHIVWHLPLFGLEYDLQNGPPWALAVISFSVLTAWLYKHTQGSLLMPALFHTTINTFAFILGMLFSEGDLLRAEWLFYGLWVGAAVIVVVVTGPNLARTPAQPEVVVEPVVGV